MVLLVLFATFSHGGAIFLTIQKSATMAGMGYTGVARWDDPSASYLNPAAGVWDSGESATTLNISSFGIGEFFVHALLDKKKIPRQPRWLDALAPDMSHRYWEIGWTRDLNYWFFRRVALRATGNRLNLGTVVANDEHGNYLGTWQPYDQANSLSLSILLPYGLSLGYTFKEVYSFLAPRKIIEIIIGEEAGGEARTFTNDYGILYDPGIGVAFGLAVHNDGGSMKFTDSTEAHSDPMPTYIRYGYTFRFHQLFQYLTGVSLSPYFSFTYSQDWITDRISYPHETWYAEGFEIGFLNSIFFRNGYFKDYGGVRIGPTKGWGIRFGTINLDVADDGDIYSFFQSHNWWVSLSLQTPQNQSVIDKLIGKKTMGWIQAILFPGAGHIYEGNARGLVYSAVSSFLYSIYAREGNGIFLFGASAVYIMSLVDYYLKEVNHG